MSTWEHPVRLVSAGWRVERLDNRGVRVIEVGTMEPP